MPSRRSRRSSNDLVLFSADDPQPVVNWLCERFGLQVILQAVAEFRPAGQSEEAPAKRPYKRRAAKKGGARKSSKKGGARKGRGPNRPRKQAEAGAEQG